MTDLEMTKLCADAMGLAVKQRPIRGTIMRWWYMDVNVELDYNPLHDEAQALALVKRLDLSCNPALPGVATEAAWQVHGSLNGQVWAARNDDLNRAIVECAAKLRANQEKG